MDLAEAAKILDPWVQNAKTKRFRGQPWPVGSLIGTFGYIELSWYVDEDKSPGGVSKHRWPQVNGRVSPQMADAIRTWILYHGGPRMFEE